MPMTVAELEVAALEAAGGPGGGLTPAELHGAVIGIGVTDVDRILGLFPAARHKAYGGRCRYGAESAP